MTSIEVPSPPLNESLDYGQPLEFGYSSSPTPLTSRASSSTRSEASPPRILRLPDPQFSNQVADSDLTAEEDQQ